MRNKKVVRLTESQLHNIIAESVNQILNEIGDTKLGQYMLGALKGRNIEKYGYNSSKTRGVEQYAKDAKQNPFSQDYGRYSPEGVFELGFKDQMDYQNAVNKELPKDEIKSKIDNMSNRYDRFRSSLPSVGAEREKQRQNDVRKKFNKNQFK